MCGERQAAEYLNRNSPMNLDIFERGRSTRPHARPGFSFPEVYFVRTCSLLLGIIHHASRTATGDGLLVEKNLPGPWGCRSHLPPRHSGRISKGPCSFGPRGSSCVLGILLSLLAPLWWGTVSPLWSACLVDCGPMSWCRLNCLRSGLNSNYPFLKN